MCAMCDVLFVGGCEARSSTQAAASSSERDNFSREGRAAASPPSPLLTAPFKPPSPPFKTTLLSS